MERKECIDQLNSLVEEGFNREKLASILNSYYQNLDPDSKKEGVLKLLELIEESRAIPYDKEISEIVGCNIQYAKHIRLEREDEHNRSYFESSEKIPDKLKEEILERDNQECVFCGRNDELVIHHIIPVGKNGATEKDNLATLCEDCHLESHGGSYSNSLHSMPYRTIKGFWKIASEN
jgi:5-methylcytosine-specific restriction endonuclease McrA